MKKLGGLFGFVVITPILLLLTLWVPVPPTHAQGILAPILFGSPAPLVAHWRTITLDHTQAGTADTASYAALVSISSQTYLKTVANGGHVANSNGYDILFATDSTFVTKLNWEVEFYDGTAGTLIAWVQVPTLSHTADTVFYMGYGNAAITTFQGNVHGTWDSNYALVAHLPNGTSLSLMDSTSNNTSGSVGGTFPAIAGQIDGAADNHAGGGDANYGNPSNLQLSGSITMEAWVDVVTNPSGGRVISKMAIGGWTGYELDTEDGRNWNMNIGSAGGTLRQAQSTAAYNAGTFTYFVGIYDGTTGTVYVNNVAGAFTFSASNALGSSANNFILGKSSNISNACDCNIDEVRISNIARSTSYLTAVYNNTKSSSTFVTVGTEN